MSLDAVALDAPAKINLALAVGPTRPDGKHEVVTVLQALALCDRVSVWRSTEIAVEGFSGDTLVTRALEAVRGLRGVSFAARIEKAIPVAAGLGGGSSDAAAALRAANVLLDAPLAPEELHATAATLGADVPFFLAGGAQLGSADGTRLEPLRLPTDYAVLLVLPRGATKESTASVYAAFDARRGETGFAARAARVRATATGARTIADLRGLPPNDLASSPLADELARHGALRADVSGAGPVVYGLFASLGEARRCADQLDSVEATWITRPASSSGGAPAAP
jgi:4-diphosphocytidyl-2-C-methyl-D-erythritol kinase